MVIYLDGRREARWTGKILLVSKHLFDPLRWQRGRMIFVASTSDPFHEAVPDEWLALMFAVMALTPWHTYQLLTKRPERMRSWLNHPATPEIVDRVLRMVGQDWPDAFCDMMMSNPVRRQDHDDRLTAGIEGAPMPELSPAVYSLAWPLKNLWLGVSVENQATANERIPILTDTTAAVRFISYEPAIGPVDLSNCGTHYSGSGPLHIWKTSLEGNGGWRKQHMEPAPQLDWVIVGGESGPRARDFHYAWALSVIHQCAAAGVPCFDKQMGSRPIGYDGKPLTLRSRKGDDLEEWPPELRVQEWPAAAREAA